MSAPRVAVVGAGYAGLTAAVELARAGCAVTVFEASRTLGGRARVVEKDGYRIDNGQHILIGAYTETLRMLRSLGVPPRQLLSRPFTLHVPGRLDLRAAELPAPFNLALGLLRSRELSWQDRFAAMRLMRHLKRRRYRFERDVPVADLLAETRQTRLLIELVWEPLCVAALNTPIAEASAQVFANVLRDSIGGRSADAEILIPRVDLTELLPFPATHFLSRNGHAVHTATPIKRITRAGEGFLLEGNPFGGEVFDHVVLATAPYHVSALLADFDEAALLRAQIDALPYEPITTVYLEYDDDIRLPEPMVGVADSVVQWLFDRGQLGGMPGMLAAVISARGPHTELSREEIGLRAHQAVERLFPRVTAPRWSTVITEKRATFACRPGLVRPRHVTPIRNLVLAGDYLDSPYPATIETAVRSGLIAARHVLRMSQAAQ
ncbi:hydroxysqualene dehydroxylase HpnE [Uliginosibacterium sp. sgz301328]|uniref:hydroxysqualene dehydroxylase HpnE n=1 Tax=Uliginosibacterium sp. sgz301328 TaxID=3243764 RepID=UPI00359EBB1F